MKTFVVLLAVVAVGLARPGPPDPEGVNLSSIQASESNEEEEHLMKLSKFRPPIRPELKRFSDKASGYFNEDDREDTFSADHPYPVYDESHKERYPDENDSEEFFRWLEMMNFCNGKSFIPKNFGDWLVTDLLKTAEESLRMYICDPAA